MRHAANMLAASVIVFLSGCEGDSLGVTLRWRLLSPSSVVDEFAELYSDQAKISAFEQSYDPLLMAGCRIAPELVRRMRQGDQPWRYAALSFLGHAGCESSTEFVSEAVQDNNAPLEWRAFALEALERLDVSAARGYAHGLTDEAGLLGMVARDIQACERDRDTCLPMVQRTFLRAFLNLHE